MLCSCTWFKPYVERWRKELELRMTAQALREIYLEAAGAGRYKFAANKFLIEQGWKEKPTKGRPSKSQVKKEAVKQAEAERMIEKDMERLDDGNGSH